MVLSNVGSRDNASAVVARLNKELEQPIMIGDVLVQIRSSVGLALCRPGEMTVDEILHQADLDMYEVKRAHKAHQTYGVGPNRQPAAP